MLRKDCPPGAYLITPQRTQDLEVSLVNLLLTHGVSLQPQLFLSRCVVCNGEIKDVHDMEEKRRIFADHQAPPGLSATIANVYACNGCGQGYWWCDKPSSSASRVKLQATKLFEQCLRGGVPLVDGDEDSTLGMFEYVNVSEQRQKGLDERTKAAEAAEVAAASGGDGSIADNVGPSDGR